MSDFDFDEIDKAVNGALSSDDTPSQPAFTPPTEPEKDTPAPTSAIEVTPAPRERVSPPAARRSAGRFMDVVHPSSDMRTKTPGFTPPTPPTPTPTPEVAPDLTDESWSQPLESPFLPDAKVEKRPLGAFSLDTPAQNADEEELLLEAPDELLLEAHAMPDPIDFAAQSNALPAETEDTGEVPAPEEPAANEELSAAMQFEEAPLAFEPETPPEEAPEPVEEEPIQTGPASITQQYTEQPSSAPSSGAIYDTETYHKPLEPVAKKRSGVWIFIWILLLVILGAGAGVAFYIFVLPML